MRQHLALHNMYLETDIMLRYKRLLLILSASVLPLYLSMFRYKIFGATLRASGLCYSNLSDFVDISEVLFKVLAV